MQEDREIIMQQMRAGLCEVEERYQRWLQTYLEFQYQFDQLGKQRAYLRRLIYAFEASKQRNG
jgi:hypothetical protein